MPVLFIGLNRLRVAKFLRRTGAGLLLVTWVVAPLRAAAPPAASPNPTAAKEEAPRPSSGTPLDATPAEIVKFYGPVLKANARVRDHQILEGTVLDGNLYGKNGFVIRVVFYKGRSVLVEYTRAEGVLTLADVNPLLAANAGNSTWEPGKDNTAVDKFYRRVDDRALAHWSTEKEGSLMIFQEDATAALGGGMIH